MSVKNKKTNNFLDFKIGSSTPRKVKFTEEPPEFSEVAPEKIVNPEKNITSFNHIKKEVRVFSEGVQKEPIYVDNIKRHNSFLKLEDIYASFLKSTDPQYKNFLLNLLSSASNLDSDISNKLWSNKLYKPYFDDVRTSCVNSFTKIEIVENKIYIKDLFIECPKFPNNLIIHPFSNTNIPIPEIQEEDISFKLYIIENFQNNNSSEYLSFIKNNELLDLETFLKEYDLEENLYNLLINNKEKFLESELPKIEELSQEYIQKFYEIYLNNKNNRCELLSDNVFEEFNLDVENLNSLKEYFFKFCNSNIKIDKKYLENLVENNYQDIYNFFEESKKKLNQRDFLNKTNFRNETTNFFSDKEEYEIEDIVNLVYKEFENFYISQKNKNKEISQIFTIYSEEFKELKIKYNEFCLKVKNFTFTSKKINGKILKNKTIKLDFNEELNSDINYYFFKKI